MYWEDYVKAQTVAEALNAIAQYGADGRIIAGGTDLILQLKEGRKKAKCLIDITSVAALHGIHQDNGRITVGAATTHFQASSSPVIRTGAPVLSEASGQIGTPQLRNIATLGGNIINAQPAADSVVALHALDAVCTITSTTGAEELPISRLFSGPGVTTLDRERSLLTQIRFNLPGDSEGCAFYRLTRRKAVTLPLLNCGAWVRWNPQDQRISDLRIAMGPVAPVPKRLQETEGILVSDRFSGALLKKAMEKVFEEANPRSGLRGGQEYRKAMTPVIAKRALLLALERAGWKNES